MNEVIEYKIITAEDANALERKVNAMIKIGFQPYGEPMLATVYPQQAMVKHAKKA